jgi:hypothetical protein
MDPLVQRLTTFIRWVGIPVSFRTLIEPSFLPGVLIERGALVIDEAQLKYPGDLLHEAGHLAVVPATERLQLSGEQIGQRPHNAAEEMMAMAWSYAACMHLALNPQVVFHAHGYKGAAKNLLQGFSGDDPLGVPMLQWVGMTVDVRRAGETGQQPYPAMLCWLRE